MLLEFKTKNYKSFVDEMNFVMIPAPKQKGLDYSVQTSQIGAKKIRSLCSAIVYGSNASGKTNIFGAMDTFKAIVIRGNIRNADAPISMNAASSLLELIPNCNANSVPVEFAIKFIENDLLIDYSLTVDLGNFLDREYKRKILEEKLSVNEKTVFIRTDTLEINMPACIKPFLNSPVRSVSQQLKDISVSSLNNDELFLNNGFKNIFAKKLAALILDWFKNSRDSILRNCEEVYNVQKTKLTKQSLRIVYPEYEHSDDEIWDYPDFEDFLNKITSKTRVIIINSPNNPTGTVYDEKTIKRLAEILSEKQKEYGHPIFLLSDEPYRELIYDDFKYPFVTNYYDNSIVCYSFSKSLSVPGERIGYIAVSKNCYNAYDLSAAFGGAARALGYACAPSMFQFILPSCLGKTADLNFYKENRDLLYNGLKDIGYEVVYPHGAFYMFVKALEKDDEHFSNVAKEMDLLIVPSKSFGYPGYVRVSYCVDKNMIVNALPTFKKLYDKYGG